MTSMDSAHVHILVHQYMSCKYVESLYELIVR